MRPIRWLRFLLIWPALSAYRARARRSLRWRLAGYNLATLIAGLATAMFLVGALAAVAASARRWADEEPADDARAAAEFLVATGLVQHEEDLDSDRIRPVLEALSNGDVPLYRGPRPDQFDVRPKQLLQGVQGIALFLISDGSQTVTSGYQGFQQGDPVFLALDGSTNLRANSLVEDTGSAEGIGAYPLFTPAGEVFGVVVVEKAEIQAPQGWAVLRAEVRPVVTTVWVGSIVAAIPGLFVAASLAILAARSVGGRIRDLSDAAGSLAEGSLDSRVAVRGEDEVASLARSFNVMAERLQQTMGSLEAERVRAVALLDANRQLIANVSHELRTPVALIRGQVEALGEEQPENARVEMALRETDRLEALVSDLFQLASADAGGLRLNIEPMDVGELARQAAEPLVDTAEREARVTLVIETPVAVAAGYADAERLVRVIQNLLRNAIRHTPEGGLVRVSVEDSAEAVLVSVADTGEGIGAEDLPHIFERFYRGDASRSRDTGGAGLGLAIAAEMVEAMGGTITAESSPGEGASFVIALARVGSGAPHEASP